MIDPRLDALCRLCGIQPQYHDIWGKAHDIKPDTVRAFVRAMGIDLEQVGIDGAIARLEAEPWRRPLASVQVIRQGDNERAVCLRLPEDEAVKIVRYTIALEDGTMQKGDIRPSDLRVTERATVDGRAYGAYALPLGELPHGYHRFELTRDDRRESMSLIIAPNDCYLPDTIRDHGRVWGVALQLYALRSARNWGIGDFSDLRLAVEMLGERGAAVIGLNPLHALYPHNPAHVSPYSPSSRLFVNVLYLDVEHIAEFSQSEPAQQMVYTREFQRRLEELRAQPLVDYVGVAAVKFPVLEKLYEHFRAHHLERDTPRGKTFREFQTRGGEWLQRQSLYEALQEHFHRRDANVWGWPVWPEAYRNPASSEVKAWADANRVRIEFYQYLQWQVDRQLGAVGRASYDRGLAVGLYQDLAVSVDRGGAETWALQSLYAREISIGAPPDELALQGQNWGLPPLVPQRLRDAAYAPFIATLRANMRHGGALRIDHVMGLMRLFWVPPGVSSQDGAYVSYPFRDLLGILALESHRNRCLVIGEDLGTVPEEVRNALAPMNVLSYRLFYFERTSSGDFKSPPEYPELALATVTTHDLPTLAGYWKGQDIIERDRLKLFPSDEARDTQFVNRVQDRARLLIALQREGLLPEGMTVDPASSPEMTPTLARAVHAYLARSPAKLVMLHLEDIIGELCQPNLPGTVDEYPNWRRKLGVNIDELLRDRRALQLFDVLRDTRGPGIVERKPAPGGGAVIPNATYRLQFHKDFTFRHAEALVPYLARLGISHCYASPYLKARSGSRHGYDIVDHNALNPEIGSWTDYEAFVDALQRHGLSQVLDIVPNHMGVGSDNQWWLDVLENGSASLYASFFDIDWYPLKPELRGKVLLPILGDHYGAVLERGELKLAIDIENGAIAVHYYEHHFPVDPSTYPSLLARDLNRLEAALGAEHAYFAAYQSLISAFMHLPGRTERAHERIIERYRDKELHKRRLAELCAAEPAIRKHLESLVSEYNGEGEAPRRELLHELLEQQAYRLAYWRVASDEINYRRFFDINDLAALRMENPQTFFTTHRLISELVAQGKVSGLRIDHPDGLYDPLEYYRRLHSFVVAAVGSAANPGREEIYLVVEKILASHERLPEWWPVHGTTGYEFVNLVNGWLVHGDSEARFDKIYQRFIGREVNFDELLADRKRFIMRVALASELNGLANRLNRLSEEDWYARDFTLSSLRFVLREVIAYFPVYRTYIRDGKVSADDRRYIEWAVAQAKKQSPAADVSAFDFLRRILLLEGLEKESENYRRAVIDFAMRVQQYSAPVMAKGLEDTAFYSYHRLISLNEVGGDPRRFGLSTAAFHHANAERATRFPHSMLATSTHDTKRSEDVRARLNVLSEIPDDWRAAVMRWARMNRAKKRKLDDGFAPDRNDEYLLYQTLLGAWPLTPLTTADDLKAFGDRIEAYMLKATREAKVRTSWINQNVEYETAIQQFLKDLLAAKDGVFLQDFAPFAQRIMRPGLYNSLSQTHLKLTVPGVPDIYQGNELWDFSLVDPDNRRPVDYERRKQMLAELQAQFRVPSPSRVRALLDSIEDGRAKLYLTWKLLTFRQAQPELFRDGDYLSLAAEGRRADHVCAFARRYRDHVVVSIAPRWLLRLCPDGQPPLGGAWQDTTVAVPSAGVYENVLTGEELRFEGTSRPALTLANALTSFPVALLRLKRP
jgi:(1->4)-alpha-D-glucan 1-alpha-D-glucosylmutase